jgi:ADP-ribose pyrophosphatase YjhB (NUDIX family)
MDNAGDRGLCGTQRGEDDAEPGGKKKVGKSGGGRCRIEQASRRLQAEAASILSGARPYRTRSVTVAAGDDPLPPGIESRLGKEERTALGEVTDGDGRLLLCMPPDQALSRGLRLRLCVVALRNADGKVVLHKETHPDFSGSGPERPAGGKNSRPRMEKKPDECSALWDLYSGHVRVGEAWESAALRLLETWAGTAGSRLVRLAEIGGDVAGGAHIRYYGATLASGLHPKHELKDTLEADRDELAGLAANMPELLSASLLLAAREKIIFPEERRPG